MNHDRLATSHVMCLTVPSYHGALMEPKAKFLSLAEELQHYILSFLSHQDILHYTSVSYNLLIDVMLPLSLDGLGY